MKYNKILFISLLIVFIIFFRYALVRNHYLYNQLSLDILSLITAPITNESSFGLNRVEAMLSDLSNSAISDQQKITRLQGYYYHLLDEPTKAQEAWGTDDLSATLFLWQGDQARLQQEYDEALKWLNYGSHIFPELSVYPYQIGLINEDLSKWNFAIESYEKAIVLDSIKNTNRSHLYYRLAINYHRRDGYQNLEKAFDAYDKAISINDFTSLNDLADAYYGRGDITQILGAPSQQVIRDFKTALYYNPSHEWAHLMMGLELQNLKDENELVQEHLILSLEHWTNEQTLNIPLLALGEFYCKSGKNELGIDAYEKAYNIINQRASRSTIEKMCAELGTD